MIEQLTPITEIKGLETLVDHFRQEYGERFLRQIEEGKLLIGISLTPQEAVLQWRGNPHDGLYALSASQGCITGYKFKGAMMHNREEGVCYLPKSRDEHVTVVIELKYPQ